MHDIGVRATRVVQTPFNRLCKDDADLDMGVYSRAAG
jgi:hypothetical protein